MFCLFSESPTLKEHAGRGALKLVQQGMFAEYKVVLFLFVVNMEGKVTHADSFAYQRLSCIPQNHNEWDFN